jgi:hypothetical protein
VSPHAPNYKVAYHRVFEKQLQTCIDTLVAAGWDKKELVRRLEEAERRLTHDPSSCGEPIYNIRPLDLVVSVFCVRPFNIHSRSTRRADPFWFGKSPC